jgi:uncharacterized protein (DUF849 family)
MANKVIISVAITGGIHTAIQSPHLPITPAEIAEHSSAAANAGASNIHPHTRDP